MMQAEVVLAIEVDRLIRLFGLPERQQDMTVGNERGRIVGPPADLLPPKAIDEEVTRHVQIPDGKSHVVDSNCQRFSSHVKPPWRVSPIDPGSND